MSGPHPQGRLVPYTATQPSKRSQSGCHYFTVESDITAVTHIVEQRPKPLALSEPCPHCGMGLQGCQQVGSRAASAAPGEIVPDEVIHAA